VARFAARFADFTVAPDTLVLMREMVQAGEVDHLVPERVWQELATGLMAATPSRMFTVLHNCGAMVRLLPEVDNGQHVLLVLDQCARLGASLPVRFAVLCLDLDKGSTPGLPRRLAERWRVPVVCRELAEVVAREQGNIHRSAKLNATDLMGLLMRCDALRQPQRFAQVLLACECDARGRLNRHEAAYPQRPRLLAALAAAQTVPTASVAAAAQAAGASGGQIGEAVYQARVVAVQTAMDPRSGRGRR
jgi:tRNA nucleotidyltransferase (CCA-adding enzyme)